ncbi:acyl-CoA dehydrogenase family protein, partial [Salmonella enterica]
MLVSMLVASDEATAGSVIRNAERISPFMRYGTKEQKRQWLKPLMNGEI